MTVNYTEHKCLINLSTIQFNCRVYWQTLDLIRTSEKIKESSLFSFFLNEVRSCDQILILELAELFFVFRPFLLPSFPVDLIYEPDLYRIEPSMFLLNLFDLNQTKTYSHRPHIYISGKYNYQRIFNEKKTVFT